MTKTSPGFTGARPGPWDRLRHPTAPFGERRAALWAAGVTLYTVVAWLLVQRGLADWLSERPSLNFYVVQPAVWMGLAVLAYAGWRRLDGVPRFSRTLTAVALLLGAFHVGLFVFGGIAFEFGHSLVAGRLANYPGNMWFVATWLVGIETARAFILHSLRSRSETGAFWAVAALFAFVMTPYGRLTALTNSGQVIETLAGYLLPTFMLSVLLTWLAAHGGLGPSVAYSGMLFAFEWLSQVQPDLDWPILFIIGTTGPMLSAHFIRTIYLDTREGAMRWDDDEQEGAGRKPGSERSVTSTVVFAVSLVALVAVAGALGYRPAVVNGISMEPAYHRGDVAIINHNVDPSSLVVGDVVQYNDPRGRSVVHRIVSIEHLAGALVFTTRGDNNGDPDDSITPEAIEGRVVFSIPRLGWPALWLRGA